jgi:parallel beta-helix repeat protein
VKLRAFRANILLAIACAGCIVNVGCAGFSFSSKAASGTSTPPTLSIQGTISPGSEGSYATVTLSGTASASTIADAFGNYYFTGVVNGNYTISPSKDGFSFSPADQTTKVNAASVTGINFSASKITAATFSLSGTISPPAAGGGATVTVSGAQNAETTADNQGNYTFSGLGGGSYTVTPTKSGYNFTPASQNTTITTSSVTGMNFTGSTTNPATFSISGTISPTAGTSGTTVTLSGAANATATPNSGGNYSFTGLARGTYTVTPTKSGYSFTPTDQSINVTTANATGVNFIDAQLSSNTINILPGDNIPSMVSSSPAGTTFIIYPGTYRLTQPIVPKANDAFIGQTSCAPPATSCPAILSGSRVIGPLATFDGTNYEVAGQTQQNTVNLTTADCTPGWLACNVPEDLWFDGVPLQHLYATSLPVIESGQWWFDYTNHVIYFHDNPSGHLVETSFVPNVAVGPASNITFQYLTIEEFSVPLLEGGFWPSDGYQFDALRQANGLNWVIENCEMWGHHSQPISVNYGIQVLNNYIHDNGQLGVGGGVGPDNNMVPSGVLIQGNLITHNNYANVLPGFGAGGIKFGRTFAAVIQDNTVTNNEGTGIHFDSSSSSPVIAGNTVTGNTDGDGITFEISWNSALVYNNIVQYNGAPGVAGISPGYQIHSVTSTGMNAYCNVMGTDPVAGEAMWNVDGSDRGTDTFPPYAYYVSSGNYVHHNTAIWSSGSSAAAGYTLEDAQNQPNFFSLNQPPDFNFYHLPNLSAPNFIYDNNLSQTNLRMAFPQYQANGADVHGTADTNYTSGFPSVMITSPADQSSFTGNVTVNASASDDSGIGKVEFYVDWNLQATVTNPPYSFGFSNGATGSHVVAAMAYSNAGIQACSGVTLTEQ